MALRFSDINEIHLQNTEPGHFKEYRVRLDNVTGTVVLSWGPIGQVTVGQVKHFRDIFAAKQFCVDKVLAKTAKGYREVAEGRVSTGRVVPINGGPATADQRPDGVVDNPWGARKAQSPWEVPASTGEAVPAGASAVAVLEATDPWAVTA